MVLRRLTQVIVLVAAAGVAAHAQSANPPVTAAPEAPRAMLTAPAKLASAIDAYVATYVRFHTFSGVVLVARGDQVLAARPYGMANYEFGVPNALDTRFRIASITKRFTNILLVRLAEAGRLSAGDTLAKYFPEFPKADRITVAQLANHRSGLRDPDALRGIISTNFTPAQVVAILAKEPLGSEPGETYAYTTANYAVLAAILEKVTGRSFAALTKAYIYDPAGAKDSGEVDSTTVVPKLAAGYMPDPFSDGVSVCGPEDTSWKVGGGSSYTTAGDLHRIVRALYAGRLMKASPFDVLPHRTMFGKRSFEASGAFPGANANLTYFPDDQVTVVVLSNNYAPLTSPIAKDVAAIVFGLPYEMPAITLPATAPPPDPRILGEWVVEGYPPATIVERNGRFVLVWTRARQEALIPLGHDEYFLPLDFAQMRFTFGETEGATFSAPWSDRPLTVTRVKKQAASGPD
jgi:CubicO group peptidase (beta-lactamase class C family)